MRKYYKTAFKAIYRFNNNNHTDDMVVLFVLYGICCQQGVSGSAVCGSHIAFALYCQQADENVYKNVMDILILSVPIVGIPCYFFSEDRSLRRRHRKEWQELWKHMRRFGLKTSF